MSNFITVEDRNATFVDYLKQPAFQDELENLVVSRMWWKFSGGDLRALGFGPDQATRSRVIGSMGRAIG